MVAAVRDQACGPFEDVFLDLRSAFRAGHDDELLAG
jgi:hypothetical protein